MHPLELKEAIVEHGVLHLYGPSGTGKSHLAKHLAIELVKERYIPILISAKYYEGNFAALLDRSVEHLTKAPAESLISGALTAGSTPLLILDGFNECPEVLRSELIKGVKALQLRRPVRIVVTSRLEIPSDFSLPGRACKLDALASEERDRLISFYGGPAGSLVEILRTPLDVRIAAENAGRINSSSFSQYDLFHAYARGRLSDDFSLGFGFLTKCASIMTTVLTSVLAESEFYRVAQATAGTKANMLVETVRASGLVVFSRGHFSFWHEKIQRFFQAEALLLKYTDKAELAAALRSPRNEDTLEFVLGAQRDASSIQLCLPAIRSEALLLSLLHGEMGSGAAAAIRAAMHQLLHRAHQELRELKMTKIGEPSSRYSALSITSPFQWKEYEQRLLGLLGKAFIEGFLCEEVLDLIEHSEKECLAGASELYPRRPWRFLFPALYVGISPQSLPVSRIIEAIHGGFRGAWSPEPQKILSERLGKLEHQSPGILFLLATYTRDLLWSSSYSEALAAQILALLRRMWSTGLYHLRLEAAQLAHSLTHQINEPIRSELETWLESLLGDDVILNTFVFEALAQHRDLGVTSEERVYEEIRAILDGPRDEEACQMAGTIFANQFEEIVSDHYYPAVQALQGKDRVDFYVMAAMGREPGYMFTDLILRRLIEFKAPEAYPAFERWSSPPQPVGIISDDIFGSFLLAHIGLARTAQRLPAFAVPSDQNEESWRVWGEILFWLHKPDASQASIREACASCWRKLLGPLLLASIDPLFEMERYARSRDLRGEIYHPVETAFRHELKALYEKALPRSSELTSVFRFPSHWADDRATYMIEELGRFGDEDSALVIEPHVESLVLGRSAVNAIRSIRERLTSGNVPS
ncbi:MAG TPA: ATP-binding protein [Thermoanaerobaculia bacterium]|nr:ATP-binding protein [Thermoanaerobaculia bacterium]